VSGAFVRLDAATSGGGAGPLRSVPNFREFTFRDCLENSWRVLDRLCLVAQVDEMGCLRPVLAPRYTPNRDLFGCSRQFLEGEFCELRLYGVLGSWGAW
jgi:hypothetical protein